MCIFSPFCVPLGFVKKKNSGVDKSIIHANKYLRLCASTACDEFNFIFVIALVAFITKTVFAQSATSRSDKQTCTANINSVRARAFFVYCAHLHKAHPITVHIYDTINVHNPVASFIYIYWSAEQPLNICEYAEGWNGWTRANGMYEKYIL